MKTITEHGTDCRCDECKAAVAEAAFDAFVDRSDEEKTVEWCGHCDGRGFVILVSEDGEGSMYVPCHAKCPHRRTLKDGDT